MSLKQIAQTEQELAFKKRIFFEGEQEYFKELKDKQEKFLRKTKLYQIIPNFLDSRSFKALQVQKQLINLFNK